MTGLRGVLSPTTCSRPAKLLRGDDVGYATRPAPESCMERARPRGQPEIAVGPRGSCAGISIGASSRAALSV